MTWPTDFWAKWGPRREYIKECVYGSTYLQKSILPMIDEINDILEYFKIVNCSIFDTLEKVYSLERRSRSEFDALDKRVKSLEILTAVINPNVKVTKKQYEVEEFSTSNDGRVTSSGKKVVEEYSKAGEKGNGNISSQSNTSATQKLQININNSRLPVGDYQKK